METLLRPWCKTLSIEMAGWHQQYITTSNVEIYFLPSRHWSKRGLYEVGAKIFIPMHNGTFDISDEPIGEPLRILETLERENKIQGNVKALSLGESLEEF